MYAIVASPVPDTFVNVDVTLGVNSLTVSKHSINVYQLCVVTLVTVNLAFVPVLYTAHTVGMTVIGLVVVFTTKV